MTVTSTWLEGHLDYALGHYSQTVTVAGADYSCAVGEQARGVDVDEVGLDPARGVEVMVKTSDFTSMPTPGDVLTYNSLVYRIETVRRAPDGIHTIFDCTEKDVVA